MLVVCSICGHSTENYADQMFGSVHPLELCGFEHLCSCLLLLVIMWCLLALHSGEGCADMRPGTCWQRIAVRPMQFS